MRRLGTIFICFYLLILTACKSSETDPEFLEKYSGRYLYTADEIIRVHAKDATLLIDWRGAENIVPMPLGNNAYFVKHMNTKIQFLVNPEDGKEYLVFVPKHKDSTIEYNYVKVADSFKTPSQHFEAGNYTQAKEGYLGIQEKDSLNPIIEEWRINRMGYYALNDKNYEEALELFKINIALYPNSTNVYDSYAEALYRSGDTAAAILNYEKVLSMDSGNRNAKRRLGRLHRKQE